MTSTAIFHWRDLQIEYRTGTADEAVLKDSFDHDIYLTGCPEYQPGVEDVVVDVGAHIGTFSLLLAPQVRRVYAIEPCLESVQLLRSNIVRNRMQNVSAHRIALQAGWGRVRLYHAHRNWGHSIVPTELSWELVWGMSLRDFWRMSKLERCDLLKLNCEGAEFPIILESSVETLRLCKVILCLYHCDIWTDNTDVDLVRKLDAAGFSVDVRNRKEKRGWIVAVRQDDWK